MNQRRPVPAAERDPCTGCRLLLTSDVGRATCANDAHPGQPGCVRVPPRGRSHARKGGRRA